MMWRGLAIFGLLLAFTSPALAHTVENDALGLSFSIPDDYQPLDYTAKKVRYATGEPPAVVYGLKGTKALISYDYKKDESSTGSVPLETLQKALTKIFENVTLAPRWIKNEIVTINGHDWIYMETITADLAEDARNYSLYTPWRGGILTITYSASDANLVKYEDSFRKSIASIKLKL